MAQLDKEKAEMEEAVKTCALPDVVDRDAVNDLLVFARVNLISKQLNRNR